MANQEQNPPQQEQPFVAAKQVGFNLEDIILNTNNEVALLYPEHNNKDHFKCVSDFISKCCLRKPFTRSPNMYKEYLAEFWYSAKALENSKVSFSTPTGGIYGEVGVNTFRNAIGAHYLPHSSEYVAPPSIDIVRPWFETIGYGEAVPAKGTLKKSLLPPRWRLLMAQIIQCLGGKTRGFDQITNKDAIILYSLANGINIDYASIFWEDIIIKLNKKHREKVVPYTRFLSLLMMHKMKEGYGDGELTLYPTQVFSVNNWALKPNQPEEPPFTDHMLAICAADTPVVFKAPKTSSKAESVSQGTKPGAKPGHKKLSTSSKQPFPYKSISRGNKRWWTSKAPTIPKLVSPPPNLIKENIPASHGLKHPSRIPSFYTPVDTGMHKEDQQATGGPTSLGVTSEARANPQLSSGMSAFNLNEPIYLASFIIHSESASGNDASAVSTAEADPGKSAPSDFVPQQQDLTKSVSEGLETILTQPRTGKGANSIASQVEEEEASSTIKLEDLAKLVDEDEEDKVHTTTKDTSVPKSSSPRSSQIQELTNQLNELLDLPSKFNELAEEEDFTKTVTSLTSQVAELKTLQWELPAEFVSLPVQVVSVQAKLKTLDALLAGYQSVPSAGQADTMAAEGEKNTNQATISQLFQRRSEKNAEKENLNNQQPKPTTPPATTIIPPIITTTTTQMQSPPQNPQKGSSQPKGEHIKKDKGKKAMSSKDAEEVSTESDSDDETTHVPGSMVESSKKKDLKKFDFVTKDGEHVHLTEEQISAQKKIEEEAKAEAARREGEMRKEELIDLLGPEVVNKYYNDKLQYDRYCDKMLNRRAKSRITNCDILTRKGPITLKVYREDDTSEIIPEFKASDLHLGEWREVIKACPNKKGKG
ncbi:hypothetical protein Tco_0261342 [Tanacetum coccineum]